MGTWECIYKLRDLSLNKQLLISNKFIWISLELTQITKQLSMRELNIFLEKHSLMNRLNRPHFYNQYLIGQQHMNVF